MSTITMRSDADLDKLVTDELWWDPRVDSTAVAVSAKQGVVTLAGTVGSYAQKVATRDAAHRIQGVLDVVDKLEVKLAATPRSDFELAHAVRSALMWDVYVPDQRIKSTVSEGWVTLEGDVDRAHERADAERVVANLSGVRGVTNRIVARPSRIDARQIQRSIEEALERRAEREAKAITVSVDSTTVRLSGTVRSWSEKYAVERTALYSPGVTEVKNSLVVDSYA